MSIVIPIALLASALLNLVHWAITKEGGSLPSPAGVPGLVLGVWCGVAVVLLFAGAMRWIPAEVAWSCFLLWGVAKVWCAVGVRQARVERTADA